MLGHKYVFLRKNMDQYLKIIPITHSYLEVAANSSKEIPHLT